MRSSRQFGGAKVIPFIPVRQGRGSSGGKEKLYFCKRLAVNKSKLFFATVPPMHLLRPENLMFNYFLNYQSDSNNNNNFNQ